MGAGHSADVDYEGMLFADKKSQTVTMGKDSECKGETAPRRCLSAKDELSACPKDKDGNPITTVWEAFQNGVKINGDGECFGVRPFLKDGKRGAYKWVTYKQVDIEARALGAALRSLGIETSANVGMYAKNRIEWCVANLGNFSQKMRSVALYDTLGPEAVNHILGQAGLVAIYASKDKIASIIGIKKDNPDLPLKHLIQFDVDERFGNVDDFVEEQDKKEAAEVGLQLHSYQELLKKGQEESEIFPTAPTADELAFIMYTSGTTGLPKGAMLSHGNLMATASGSASVLPVTAQDIHISYLPLAHIFETIVQTLLVGSGAKIGFFQGDVKKLTEDFIALRPTILCGVPRVFGKIYDKVIAGVKEANCIKGWYFNKALAASSEASRRGERITSYDTKVWGPLSARIGFDKVRLIVTGAAPMPPYLFEFLKVVVNCTVLQGYGMTETAAAVSVTLADDLNLGHVGPPLSCSELKLVDIPEMNYLSTDKHPRGEVWARGPNIFQGYFANEAETKKALMGDGWIATGDVGRFNPNGTLSIIDRKKNIFKLSQGEYIAVEKVEGFYTRSEAINQVWVYGNSYKPFIVATVVPDAAWVVGRAQKEGLWNGPVPQLASPEYISKFAEFVEQNYDAVKSWVLADMKNQESKLKGFEKVRDILIEYKLDNMLQGFNVDNNCLTPSFKLKRPGLLGRYVDQLKELYAKNGDPAKPEEKWGGK